MNLQMLGLLNCYASHIKPEMWLWYYGTNLALGQRIIPFWFLLC